MSFDVTPGGEERITLVAEKGGVEHTIVHVLREPTASELRRYSKMRSEFNVRRRSASLKKTPLEADEWLWGVIAINVEGYTIDGAVLDATRTDWKDHVPPHHKVEAVAALVSVAVEDEEDVEKNSHQPSGAS